MAENEGRRREPVSGPWTLLVARAKATARARRQARARATWLRARAKENIAPPGSSDERAIAVGSWAISFVLARLPPRRKSALLRELKLHLLHLLAVRSLLLPSNVVLSAAAVIVSCLR